jgi:hypothetical protein
MEEYMSGTTFDLRDVLADRAYPTASVDVWFDDIAGRELDELDNAINETSDPKELKKLEAEFEAKRKEFAHKKYTFALQGISQRRREDIQTKGYSEFPIKRDMFGRDDVAQETQRQYFVRDLLFEAFIVSITNPDGLVQEHPELDVIKTFTGYAPFTAIQKIDLAIGALDSDTDIQRFGQQDADFLSKP